jgi:WD40 repeat protein
VWVDLESGARRPLASGSWERVVLSPNGELAVGSHPPGPGVMVEVVSTADGRRTPLRENHNGIVHALAFSRDGRLFATGGNDGKIRVWNRDPKPVQEFNQGGGEVSTALFSADAQALFSTGLDNSARQWNLSSGVESVRYDTTASRQFCLALSPGEDRVAIGSEDGTLGLYGVDGSGRLARVNVTQVEGFTTSLVFSSDGSSLFAGTTRGVILRFKIGR